jgi:hypothetical protein
MVWGTIEGYILSLPNKEKSKGKNFAPMLHGLLSVESTLDIVHSDLFSSIIRSPIIIVLIGLAKIRMAFVYICGQ